uniref:Ig-like domain-containing protein n=1 Tax=Sinocyclocheilus grahami TaxID=75366 RepID=A0A672PSM5_SINGR
MHCAISLVCYAYTVCFSACLQSQVLCVKVTGCTGGSVMFKCMNSNQRKPNDQHKRKYFCRIRNCRTGISTESQRGWVNNGSFSLYGDENSRFFTVFIRNLSREDDGEYTCGNNQEWSHDVTLEVNRSAYDTLLPTTLKCLFLIFMLVIFMRSRVVCKQK